MKTTLILLLSLFFILSYGNNDSLNNRIRFLEDKISSAHDKIEQLKQGQLNYQIERDLLKETYSNNYERINTVITIILSLIGVFAFFGIKDINEIKKEYQGELENLRRVKTEFEIKSQSFDSEKGKFEMEIKEIVKQNEEQSNKIKVLELKEKIEKLLNENQVYDALQYCSIGLEIAPKDISFLNSKAIICARLNQFEESRNCFRKALEIEPENTMIIGNYVESLYFLNELDEAKKIIEKHKKYFSEKEEGRLLHFFDLLEKYHTENEQVLKELITNFLDFNNIDATKKYFKSWSLKDALYFIYFQQDSNKKAILQNIIWYLDGQLNARTVAENLGIQIP